MRLLLFRVVLGLGVVAVLCGTAFAQTGAIAGVVRDTSGAVLPGVTVEAASPALIEKTRTVVTDEAGQYKVIDLRPGIYTVTFTLAGFSTVKREGIELTAGFTAPVNAEMKVGGLEETVVVTGASPVVDVQNVREQRVLTRDVLDTIPTAKSIVNLAALVPGMVVIGTSGPGQDVGGSAGENFQGLTIHGGRRNDQQTLFDGMSVAMVQALGGSVTPTALGDGSIEQTILEVSGHSAEFETGGVVANMLPKQGGNAFHGTVFGNFANEKTQSNNYSADLKARGLSAPNPVEQISDFNPSFGGPIRKDKLWFFGAYRDWRIINYTNPNTRAPNLNATGWTYVPDLTQRPDQGQLTTDVIGRATWQLTAKQKLALTYDYNNKSEDHGTGGTVADEANYLQRFRTNIVQTTWNSPMTNRLLLEAGLSLTSIFHTSSPRPGAIGPSAIESTTGERIRAVAFGTNAGNPQVYRDQHQRNDTFRGAMSYVTGTHAFKVGFTEQNLFIDDYFTAPADYEVTLVNGAPSAVTYLPTPYPLTTYAYKSAAYAQDQWKITKMTVNLGLRYDHLRTRYPNYTIAATDLLPARAFSGADVLGWSDLSPRLGLSYDVFGNGKTAAKASLSRYVLQEAGDLTRAVDPAVASGGILTRTWLDANHDFIPQGNPLNPAANGELGPSPNNNFGKLVTTMAYAPDWQRGYGVRPYDWEFETGVQQELLPNVALNASYYRRFYGNFTITDNTLVAASDYDPFCITAPQDSRLPNGGGQQICGLLDLNPSRLGQLQNLGTRANGYAKQIEHWNGMDLSINARLKGGALVQGGVSTGKTLTDNCAVFAKVPEAGTANITGPLGGPYCRQESPFLTQAKLLGSYKLPWNVQVSGAFQSIPGGNVLATYIATNALIRPSLGRNLSAGATATASINLITPNTVFGDRVNQLDMRFTRIFKVRGTTIRGMVDLYNLANRNTVLTWNNTYGTTGATWLTPTAILSPRLLKVGGQIDF
jgi:hypothetical protein